MSSVRRILLALRYLLLIKNFIAMNFYTEPFDICEPDLTVEEIEELNNRQERADFRYILSTKFKVSALRDNHGIHQEEDDLPF